MTKVAVALYKRCSLIRLIQHVGVKTKVGGRTLSLKKAHYCLQETICSAALVYRGRDGVEFNMGRTVAELTFEYRSSKYRPHFQS